jgi:hypothetical protein
MKKCFLTICLCVSLAANAGVTLSDSAQVSLLSCEPGKEVYARFGHSAIRVFDLANNIDYAYNYGIFDFSTKFFYAKFIHGATDYNLEAWHTDNFLHTYIKRKSSVIEQTLNLTQTEKQKIFDALEKNALPENKTYRYNFIYDNCATRPFMMITNNLDESWDIAYQHRPTTYRTIIDEYVGRNTWQRFGIDFLIGRESDRMITTPDLIAFPLYTAHIIGSMSIGEKPLVSDTQMLCQFPLQKPDEKAFFSPALVCSLILIIIMLISYLGWQKRKYFAWVDFLLFLLSGLLGTIVFYLMCFSTHPLVDENYNLLWLNPLQLIFAFLLLKQNWRKPLSYFALFNTFTTLLAIIVLVTRFQWLNAAFLPLMAMLLVRSILFFQMNFKR